MPGNPISYVATERYLYLQTPLPENDLLLTGFTGHEAISRLFHFQVQRMTVPGILKEVLASQDVAFEIQDVPGPFEPREYCVQYQESDMIAGEVQKIFQDTKRTVAIRIQQVEASMVLIEGESNCRHLNARYKFNLNRHYGGGGGYNEMSTDDTMKSDGKIELDGVDIAINGSSKVSVHGGEVASSADTTHSISGATVVSDGSATNTVKGGMVMLNP